MVCLAEHQGTQPKVALTPLLLYSCLRVNGLMFDLTAAALALIALAFVRAESIFALRLFWLFNIEGTLNLIYANIATFRYHVDPVQLGASYYLPAINVPAKLTIHILIFVYLLRRLLGGPSDKVDPAEPVLSLRLSVDHRHGVAPRLDRDAGFMQSNGHYGEIMPRLTGANDEFQSQHRRHHRHAGGRAGLSAQCTGCILLSEAVGYCARSRDEHRSWILLRPTRSGPYLPLSLSSSYGADHG